MIASQHNGNLIPLVDSIQALGPGAVKIVPEVAGEKVLVEDCPGGAEEGELLSPAATHVEELTAGPRVSVVTPEHSAPAGELRDWDGVQHGVVLPRGPGQCRHQHLSQVPAPSVTITSRAVSALLILESKC